MVDARELAVHAVSNGAKAIGAMPPVFFKPANVQALALTIASICNTVPDVPCYYYHIPSMTGVALVMYDFMVAIEPLAANFAGIKYTGLYTYPGFMDVQKCMNYKDGKYEVLSGREDMMLEALSLGVKGHVGSQFNFAGDLFNGIREQYATDGITTASQTEIRGRQFNAVELIHSWLDASPTGVNGAKYFMNLAGVPVGEARLPNIPVDAPAGKALDAAHAQFCAAGENRKLRMCQHKAAIAGN
jgi:N-acetylneuraminate lyase